MSIAAEDLTRLREILGKISFLQNLKMADLDRFLGALDHRPFAKGETLIRQGEIGTTFHILTAGSVNVYRKGTLFKKLVRTMSPGSYFGEVALLNDTPRTATIIAASPGECYVLTRKAFDQILLANPAIGEMIRKAGAIRQAADAAREATK